VAEVVEQDITLNAEGQIELFRTKLRVSFKYERTPDAPEWAGTAKQAT
jgi:flavin-binding protein dodecin